MRISPRGRPYFCEEDFVRTRPGSDAFWDADLHIQDPAAPTALSVGVASTEPSADNEAGGD
eukprot:5807869-Pyramimonas_sp.AAC.1